MKDLDAQTTPIGQLLSQEYFFRIPSYQRPFSWDLENFDELIVDLLTAAKNKDYFLGTIVLQRVDDKGNYDVVDGQQRLTSIMILLACLRDLVEDTEYKSGLQDKILQKKNVVDGIPEKVRLEVKDREIFHDMVVTPNGTLKDRAVDKLPEPQYRYAQAAQTFREKLSSLEEKDLQELITFISQKCVVVYLATSTFDDAFRLFTIVNDRGKQLRRVDVLKSMNIAPEVVTKETVRNSISQRWEDLEKELGEANFESVFHLLRLILLRDKPEGDLLREFQNRVFAKRTVNQGEPFFNLAFEYMEKYKQVFIDRDVIPVTSSEYTRWRALIHIMDQEFPASEWRACVLFYAYRFDSNGLYNFCLLIEKVYLEQWVKGVRKDERYAVYCQILEWINGAKQPEEVLQAIKYDADAIREGIGRQNFYGAGFAKYVLLRLELVAAEHDNVREFTAKSIEHVLPQNPEPTGSWASKFDLSSLGEYVNSIGNLVLLSKGKNSSALNYDFDKKKARYLATRVSDYPRSIQVLGYSDWTRDIIEQRTKEAQQLVLENP